MEETNLLIPKISEVTVINGKWAIVSEYIQGKTMARLMAEEPEQKKAYIDRLVDLQMNVHAQACPLLNSLRDKMSRKIAETDFDATTRYDLHTRLANMPRENKVCHGDFNPSNIILTDDGTPYIIDWSHAAKGNAAADAARTYLLFWMNGDISGAQYYLETYCEKSGSEMSFVRKWMPIVAAAQSITAHASEREFLAGWVTDADRM